MRIAIWALAICSAFFAQSIGAQELCGVDSIFVNGFESASSPGITTSTPGALLSPGIAASITGTPAVTITLPTSGATINGPTTEVSGTYTGPINTGIVVNGVVAAMDGGKFVAHGVPLASGSNSLVASATNITANTASNTVNITQGSATAPPVSLIIARSTGYAPFLLTFKPMIGALTAGAAVSSVAIDYNGDGTDDVTAPTAAGPFTYLATVPNLYRARLTVIDSNSVTYTAYASYIVEDFGRQSGMLCDVYSYMKQRLASSDIPGALNALEPATRDEFQPMFMSHSSTLPTYVTTLGNIADGYMDGKTGTFVVVRQNTDLSLSGFHIEFAQGPDGTWRIAGM